MDACCREGDCREEDTWASVTPCRDTPPVLEPAEDDFASPPGGALRSTVTRGAVAPFSSTLVMAHKDLALHATGDTGTDRLDLQCVPGPIGIMAAVAEEPFHIWKAARQSPRTDVVAGPSGGCEQVERAPLAIAGGVHLDVHAALCPTRQASTPRIPMPGPGVVGRVSRCFRRRTRTHGVRLPTSIMTVFPSPFRQPARPSSVRRCPVRGCTRTGGLCLSPPPRPAIVDCPVGPMFPGCGAPA